MNSTDEVVSSGLQMPELSEELQIKESFFDNNVSIDNWELSNSNQFSSFINDSFASNLDEAVRRGVFGAPFFITDQDERLWGQDRLDDLDAVLAGKT